MSGQEVTDPALIAQLEAQSSLSGDAYLKTLDPTHAEQVKAMAEGRMAIPSGYQLKIPKNQQLLDDVSQYDPTFDSVNLGARAKTRGAFTSGVQARNITSFNTALGHLGTLAKAAEDLHNSSFPTYNRVINGIGPEVGATDLAGRVKAFGIAKQAVVEELGRAFKGAAPDVHGTKEWEKQISDADSPVALRRAIGQAADLLGSRINAMQDSYNAGMGTTDQPLPMLNPHARDALSAFQSDDYYDKGYKDQPALTAVVAPSKNDGEVPPAATPPAGGPSAPIAPPAAPAAGMTISDGTEQAASPTKLGEQVGAMISSGKSADDIRKFINDNGGDPSDFSNIDVNVEFAKKHPGYRPSVVTNQPLTGARSTLAKVSGSSVGAGLLASANTGLLGTLPKVAGAVGAVAGRLGGDNRSLSDIYNAESSGADFKLKLASNEHPIANAIGSTAGFIGADGLISAIPGVAKLAGKVPALIRPLVGDTLVGGLTGLGSSEKLSDVPTNVLSGAGASAAGGILGRGIAKGAGAILSPVATGAAKRLTDAGVTLTPGQLLGSMGGKIGGAVKAAEDKLTSLPGVGDVINSTRRGGVKDFNRAAINDALAPIKGTLPADMDVGHGGIAHAQQAVSDAYDNALSSMRAVPDAQLTNDLSKIGQSAKTMSQSHREQFASALDTDLQPYIAGKTQLDGGDIQAIKQGLDKRIGNLRGQGSSPQDRDLADHLADVRDSVLNLAGRTDPTSSAAFAEANQAYSMLSRVQAAAAKSKDGVFSPNQFRTAVTKRGYGTTTANVARGSAPMQQLSTDASTVLPSTVPDSGTPGRLAMGLLATGGVAGGGEGYRENGIAGMVPGALLGAAAFSKPGAKAFQYALAGSRGKTANTLGALIRANADLGGAVTAPLLLARATDSGN